MYRFCRRFFFFFQAEDGIRDYKVTGVQTCALSMGKGGHGIGADRAGGAAVRRGAPTLWNAAYNHKQFWDGRAEDLEDQAKGPITNDIEMNENPETLVKELKAIPDYVQRFDEAFAGRDGSAVTLDNVQKAIASFERTLTA